MENGKWKMEIKKGKHYLLYFIKLFTNFVVFSFFHYLSFLFV
jgi:hypothetical protein